MSRWVVALACSLAAGCLTFPAFECETHHQCADGGICEPQGHCSYADEDCDSGRRFGPHAGALAGECVEASATEGPTGSGTGGTGGSSQDTTGDPTGATGGGDGTATATGGTTGTGGCGMIGPGETIIDNDDLCFEMHGPDEWWRFENAGHGGSLIWTYTTALADPTNYVVWRLTFEEAGEYRVEVYVDPEWGQSTQAAYQVNHQQGTETVTIDQSAASGWAVLGDFSFDYLGGQWVRLHDNTGEPNTDSIRLVFDALRVTRLGAAHESKGEPRNHQGPAASVSGL
jgi:hypothetical protein